VPSDVLKFLPEEERDNACADKVYSENPSYLHGRVADFRTVYDTMFAKPREQTKIDEVQ
jgi:hypothetical protein